MAQQCRIIQIFLNAGLDRKKSVASFCNIIYGPHYICAVWFIYLWSRLKNSWLKVQKFQKQIKWRILSQTSTEGSGKNDFFNFSYWASSTPWRHVLSLKTFCWNPALSWAIRYSVFQKVKFTSNFEFVCGNLFSTFWHLMVKFGYIRWF